MYLTIINVVMRVAAAWVQQKNLIVDVITVVEKIVITLQVQLHFIISILVVVALCQICPLRLRLHL